MWGCECQPNVQSSKENKHTISLATPNNISVKLWHLNMPLRIIPWPLSCLCWASGIHRESNHGFMRSTRPITVLKRTTISKSQLKPIIENPGNTRRRNKLLVADSQTDLPGFSLFATQVTIVTANSIFWSLNQVVLLLLAGVNEFFSALNIFLSNTAFSGNVLILVALYKVTSI